MDSAPTHVRTGASPPDRALGDTCEPRPTKLAKRTHGARAPGNPTRRRARSNPSTCPAAYWASVPKRPHGPDVTTGVHGRTRADPSRKRTRGTRRRWSARTRDPDAVPSGPQRRRLSGPPPPRRKRPRPHPKVRPWLRHAGTILRRRWRQAAFWAWRWKAAFAVPRTDWPTSK